MSELLTLSQKMVTFPYRGRSSYHPSHSLTQTLNRTTQPVDFTLHFSPLVSKTLRYLNTIIWGSNLLPNQKGPIQYIWHVTVQCWKKPGSKVLFHGLPELLPNDHQSWAIPAFQHLSAASGNHCTTTTKESEHGHNPKPHPECKRISSRCRSHRPPGQGVPVRCSYRSTSLHFLCKKVCPTVRPRSDQTPPGGDQLMAAVISSHECPTHVITDLLMWQQSQSSTFGVKCSHTMYTWTRPSSPKQRHWPLPWDQFVLPIPTNNNFPWKHSCHGNKNAKDPSLG